jgi:iron(III) transport system substrate-binding protein
MKLRKTLTAAIAAAVMAACAAANAADGKLVIYSNADEEAQEAMKHALDGNGFAGRYVLQAMGTSELGGKLMAEKKNIEADIITLSTYYLDSAQAKDHVFAKLTFPHKCADGSEVPYYAPILGNTGALFVNTRALKDAGLKAPESIADLADGSYAGEISVPDITGSSTSWLMTQALISAYGDEKGTEIARRIEENAGDHLEMSGSGPLKKIRAGEAAVGFGLRHQAVADKKKGLPIDVIDPKEGNFTLTEALAVVDKGDETNPDAMKAAEIIISKARPELIKYYPFAIYPGEKVDPELVPANPRKFKEKLTVELLRKHQEMVKDE